MRSGIVPSMTASSLLSSSTSGWPQAARVWVQRLWKRSSALPSSTIKPEYMTATLWAIVEITPRS